MNQLTKKQSISILLLLNALGLLALFAGINRRATIKEHVDLPVDTPTSGIITVYTSFTPSKAEKYLTDFKQTYPDIDVKVVSKNPVALSAMLITDTNTPADVVWGTSVGPVLYLEWNDRLKGYAPPGLSDYNEEFRDSKANPYWVGLGGRMMSFCFNPEKLSEANVKAPVSWDDLLKPEYKGLIAFPDPQTTESGYFIVTSFIKHDGDVLGWEYFDNLQKNIGKLSSLDSDTCKLVAQGDYPIGMAFIDPNSPLPDNLSLVFPLEGAIWDMEAVALVNKEVVKPPALTFIQWAISPQTIELYAKDFPLRPIKTNVPLPKGYTPEIAANLLIEDFGWMAANYERLVAEWGRRYSDNQP